MLNITSLITATTSAINSTEFDNSTSYKTCIRVNTSALVLAETIVIQYKDFSGAWLPLTFMTDAGVTVTAQLTSAINVFVIDQPGTYRAVKALTANPVGVEIIA